MTDYALQPSSPHYLQPPSVQVGGFTSPSTPVTLTGVASPSFSGADDSMSKYRTTTKKTSTAGSIVGGVRRSHIDADEDANPLLQHLESLPKRGFTAKHSRRHRSGEQMKPNGFADETTQPQSQPQSQPSPQSPQRPPSQYSDTILPIPPQLHEDATPNHAGLVIHVPSSSTPLDPSPLAVTVSPSPSPSPAPSPTSAHSHHKFSARKPPLATPLIIQNDNTLATSTSGAAVTPVVPTSNPSPNGNRNRNGNGNGNGAATGATPAPNANANAVVHPVMNDDYYEAHERDELETPYLESLQRASSLVSLTHHPNTNPIHDPNHPPPHHRMQSLPLPPPIIKWKKGELLGFGAYGQVFLGLNLENGQLMAVKQVPLYDGRSLMSHASSKLSDRAVQALEVEIAMMKLLPKHENIVAYLGTLREQESSHTNANTRDVSLQPSPEQSFTPSMTTLHEPPAAAAVAAHPPQTTLLAGETNQHSYISGDGGGGVEASIGPDRDRHPSNSSSPSHSPTASHHPHPHPHPPPHRQPPSTAPAGPKMFNIFLEYVPGGSIASLLKRFGKFNEGLVKIYVKQILQGLRFLPSHGVLHRDIKGANILVDNKSVCKLADL